ncbi:hypothetical protein [Plebeiibacterium sediminum]|uniref:Uncharacterized protein n=1 Tax=Plebeiibacterium sediminum TaxID=2992112 RepID=A0AAE3SG62_9BACT|nr:hypothetical protein [Plebeiobacterium sediminum]MCW3786963.1 hypothetical protein [Plebeiobacterium sediminum]
MKRSKIFAMLFMICSVGFSQSKDVECVKFRDGFDKFPIPGKGTITLLDGTKIKGEFKQGTLVKFDKWQWYDTKGEVHEIKKKEVERVDFYPDEKFVDKDIEININLSVGNKTTGDVGQKDLPFNIKQFKDFDQEKYYKPLILERVVKSVNGKGKESADLMLLVNNGFDSKYKVYVPLGAHQISYGRDLNIPGMIMGIGQEMGDYYKAVRVKKVGETQSRVIKYPGGIPFLFGKFRNQEFVDLFGSNPDFMQCYPKSFKRKFKYTPEFFWVYNQK